jgi:hypothetical protein
MPARTSRAVREELAFSVFISAAVLLTTIFCELFSPTVIHADVVIGLACTLRVSFYASCIVITAQFAILRLCCRCHMAHQAMANQHQQGGKASHADCTPCISSPSHHRWRADRRRALTRRPRRHHCAVTLRHVYGGWRSLAWPLSLFLRPQCSPRSS